MQAMKEHVWPLKGGVACYLAFGHIHSSIRGSVEMMDVFSAALPFSMTQGA